MERRKFTREFKLEAVRLIKDRASPALVPRRGIIMSSDSLMCLGCSDPVSGQR
jgi:hypothetical protein